VIGFVTTAKVSSVKVKNLSTLDFRFGGQLEYRFYNKFSCSLGANYIRKNSEVKQGDYIPPIGFWIRGVIPIKTTAKTDILEIPISVGYYLNGYRKMEFMLILD